VGYTLFLGRRRNYLNPFPGDTILYAVSRNSTLASRQGSDDCALPGILVPYYGNEDLFCFHAVYTLQKEDRREAALSLNLPVITSRPNDVCQISENLPSVPDFPYM